MTGKAFKLLNKIVDPGHDWGHFLRKSLSILLVAGIGAYGFNTYQRLQHSYWEDLPLHTAIDRDDKKEKVQKYLNRLIQADPNLESVWLYSWPDARSLIAVASAGNHINPLPLGYFWVEDYKEVGKLVMEQCAQMNRPDKIIMCPIMASNDAWGAIAFKIKGDAPNHWRAVYASLAHKLSHLIYDSNA